jgi:hypothetical protein
MVQSKKKAKIRILEAEKAERRAQNEAMGVKERIPEPSASVIQDDHDPDLLF